VLRENRTGLYLNDNVLSSDPTIHNLRSAKNLKTRRSGARMIEFVEGNCVTHDNVQFKIIPVEIVEKEE
jgi:hypothetical protein